MVLSGSWCHSWELAGRHLKPVPYRRKELHYSVMIRGIAAIPYLLPIGSAALGLFALLKDWHAYKHPRHRWAVAVVIGLVLTFALIRQYKDDSDRRIDKEKQSEAAKRLQLELVAANEGQGNRSRSSRR